MADALASFCEFFLECSKDQINFMGGMLKLEGLRERLEAFAQGLASTKRISKGAAHILGALLVQGEVPRGQVSQIYPVRQRRATQIIRELLDQKMVRSVTPYAPLRLNINAEMAAFLFPGLT